MSKQHICERGLKVKCRVNALKTIRHQLRDVYDALLSLEEDERLTSACGPRSRYSQRHCSSKPTLQTLSLDVPRAVAQLKVKKTIPAGQLHWEQFRESAVQFRIIGRGFGRPAFVHKVQCVCDHERGKKCFTSKEMTRRWWIHRLTFCKDEKRLPQLKEHRDISGVLFDIGSIKEKNATAVIQECTALETPWHTSGRLKRCGWAQTFCLVDCFEATSSSWNETTRYT